MWCCIRRSWAVIPVLPVLLTVLLYKVERALTEGEQEAWQDERKYLAVARLWIVEKTNSVAESSSELYRTSDISLSAKLVSNSGGWRVPCGQRDGPRILGFLDRNRYFFFQVAPHLYSRVWVDSVPDPLLPRKSGSAWNRTLASGSVTRNSYCYTKEAVTNYREVIVFKSKTSTQHSIRGLWTSKCLNSGFSF
jgi:hypothetical protein